MADVGRLGSAVLCAGGVAGVCRLVVCGGVRAGDRSDAQGAAVVRSADFCDLAAGAMEMARGAEVGRGVCVCCGVSGVIVLGLCFFSVFLIKWRRRAGSSKNSAVSGGGDWPVADVLRVYAADS